MFQDQEALWAYLIKMLFKKYLEMYKLTFVFFISFLSISVLPDTFDISINFESGYEFKSQIILAQEIRKLKSKKEIEK